MEHRKDEDLMTFTDRLDGIFADAVESGEITLADVNIPIPEYLSACPESTLQAAEEAKMHVQKIAFFVTKGPWLDNRINTVCDG